MDFYTTTVGEISGIKDPENNNRWIVVGSYPCTCARCEECRDEIKESVKSDLLVHWEDKLTLIQVELQNLFYRSRKAFDEAYDEAQACDHGCECQYIDNHYNYLKAQVVELQDEIKDLEAKIVVLRGNIDDVHETCDFADLEAEW